MNITYISSSPIILSEHTPLLDRVGTITMIRARKLDGQELIDGLKDTEILIAAPSGVKELSATTLEALPKLRFITTTTTGSDWIDMTAAEKLGITVKTCKGANAESVAEHTWAMILDLSKRVAELDRDIRNKNAYDFSLYMGKEVYGKTIGILGLGDIGSKVARIAQAFGMRILGYNRSEKQLPGVEQVALKRLLQESDIIALCLPYTEETKEIISRDAVEQMKPGTLLVNTASESIMDKAAVLEGLKSSKLYGLGIETAILQPVPRDDPYLTFPNVIINTHNGFNTEEADKRVKDSWVRNVVEFVDSLSQNKTKFTQKGRQDSNLK